MVISSVIGESYRLQVSWPVLVQGCQQTEAGLGISGQDGVPRA